MMRTLAWLSGSFVLAACATVGGEDPSPVSDGSSVSYPEKPAFRMMDIAGKEAADIDALLGAPDLTRSEGEGEFRRYTLAECALLIVLYPDEKGVKRAATLDVGALKSGEEKPDIDRCLARGKPKAS